MSDLTTMLVPTGAIWDYAGDNIPDGWLPCNGSETSISENPNLYEVLKSSQDSDAIVFSNHEMVLEAQDFGHFNSQYTDTVAIIKENDIYRMWFIGYGGTTNDQTVLYCESDDMKHWHSFQQVLTGGLVAGYDDVNIHGAHMIKDGATYKMWYGARGAGDKFQILYAESVDGINWTNMQGIIPYTEPSGNSLNIFSPCVIKNGENDYTMWYEVQYASDPFGGNRQRTWRATSVDGINWTGHQVVVDRQSTGFDAGGNERPFVLKISDTDYRIFLVGKSSVGDTSDLVYGTSVDGITWGNWVDLNVNSLDPYLGHYVSGSYVFEEDGVYNLLVSGADSSYKYKLFKTEIKGLVGEHEFKVAIDINEEGTYDTLHVYRPCIVKESPTSYKVWYDGANGSTTRIIYAESTDGITWSNYQVVLSPGAQGTYDSQEANKSWVIKDGATYKMWYSGTGGSPVRERILYCESADGITWTNHQLAVNDGASGTGYDSDGTSEPTVINDGGTYKMWYNGHQPSETQILYCESADGITWTNHQLVLNNGASGTGWDSASPYNPVVIKDNTTYKMWYCGYNGTDVRMIYTESSDGINWSNFKLILPPDASKTGYDSSSSQFIHVVKESDTLYKYYYSGHDGTNYRILYVEMDDTQTVIENDPVNFDIAKLSVDLNSSGTGYDTGHVMKPCVLKESETSYKMWYVGNSPSTNRILYAESTDGENWFNHQLAININSSGTGYDTSHSSTPFVMKDGSTYKIWYDGAAGSNHRILYAESTDGINWSNHQLAINIGSFGSYNGHRAHQPFVIKESETSYKMWYCGYSGTQVTGDGSGGWRILYAESTDGINWSNHQLVIDSDNGTLFERGAHEPKIIKESETSYKMLFTGEDASSVNRLLYAESVDGINWIKHQLLIDINSSGTGYDTTGIYGAWVLEDADTYKVWYGGNASGNIRILHTEVDDLNKPLKIAELNMDIGTEQIHDQYRVYSSSVLYDSDEGKYKIWYQGVQSTANYEAGIMYAESVDGTTWTKRMLIRNGDLLSGYDSRGPEYVTVVRDNATSYKMWFTTSNGGNSSWMFFMTSTDGINWEEPIKVLELNSSGTGYDTTIIYDPHVIYDINDSKYKIWYASQNGSYHGLYAESTDGINWSNFQRFLYQGISGTGYDTGSVAKAVVTKEDETFIMYYCGQNSGSLFSVIRATSIDGINWSNFEVVLQNGAEGTYDTTSVIPHAIINEPNLDVPIIYYIGSDGSYNYRLLRAIVDNFKLPDLRGRVSVCDGQGISLSTRVLGQEGGAELHTLSWNEMASHGHQLNTTSDGTYAISNGSSVITRDAQGGYTRNSSSVGGGGSHNNMQPYIVFNKMIKN